MSGSKTPSARFSTSSNDAIKAASRRATTRAISDATLTRPDIDPDRGSFTIALNAARDQLTAATGVITNILNAPVDLLGAIGRQVLDQLMPQRRSPSNPRVVKRAISVYTVNMSASGPGSVWSTARWTAGILDDATSVPLAASAHLARVSVTVLGGGVGGRGQSGAVAAADVATADVAWIARPPTVWPTVAVWPRGGRWPRAAGGVANRGHGQTYGRGQLRGVATDDVATAAEDVATAAEDVANRRVAAAQ